jgi:hypothetical protein
MSYSQFTLKQIKEDFLVTLVEDRDLFAAVAPRPISPELAGILAENVPLALAINTEKARSELIISPVLVELRKLFARKISLFSGVDFVVAPESNLNGFCDFIISHSPEQFFITAPVIAIVEAKNENIVGGLGQCLAELIAVRLFNEREGNPLPSVYGAVTTGSAWKFLKLADSTAYLNPREYHIEAIEKIMGILAAMVNQEV